MKVRLFENLRKVRAFLGTTVSRLLAISSVAAVLISLTEIAFAILIQSFLVSMDVLSPASAALPSWAPATFRASLIYLSVFAVLRGLLQWFKVYSHAMTLESFSIHMRMAITKWALYFSKESSSSIITLINDRVGTTSNLITAFQNQIINGLTIALLLYYLLARSFGLAAAGFTTLIAFGLLLKRFDRQVKLAGEDISHQSHVINAKLLDALRNLHYLKVCRFEPNEIQRLSETFGDYFRSTRVYVAIRSTKFAAPQFIGIAVIVLISAYNRKFHLLGGGAFVSFVYLFIRCSQLLADISTGGTTIRMYYPQFQQLFRWWKDNEKNIVCALELSEGAAAWQVTHSALAPTEWNLERLEFHYDGKSVLKPIDLRVPGGKITVLKGPSGVGKSTLLHLLAGILAPSGGKVTVNAKFANVPDAYAAGAVRFGYVGAEPHVISGTVFENLVYGFDRAPAESTATAALAKAACADFIPESKAGLARRITDRGEGLSTGQKQRLMLARALLSQPSALLLDEPTANLDEKSVRAILETLRGLRDRMTIVVATHQPQILEIADQVIELS